MPVNFIKELIEYSTQNKFFFIFVVVLFFVVDLTLGLTISSLGPFVMAVLMMGYGLQVSEDIINGGSRLPKIKLKKIISYGIKGMIVSFFYVTIQVFLLAVVTFYLRFPIVAIEEFVLDYGQTLELIRTHDFASFVVFVVSSVVIVYVTVFFMEIALARLADGGNLKNAFNFPRIKHAIDIIGWREYAIDYTKIIFVIIVLTFILNYKLPVGIIDSTVDTVVYFLIFVTEYVGIGNIYKVYKAKKELVE